MLFGNLKFFKDKKTFYIFILNIFILYIFSNLEEKCFFCSGSTYGTARTAYISRRHPARTLHSAITRMAWKSSVSNAVVDLRTRTCVRHSNRTRGFPLYSLMVGHRLEIFVRLVVNALAIVHGIDAVAAVGEHTGADGAAIHLYI